MNRQEVFDWCRECYNTEPDHPWSDEDAVLRHKHNNKWFGLVVEVNRSKLGLEGEGTVHVLNVKCDPNVIGSLRMQPGFYPAYHMNKEYWISILLDGPASEDEIKDLIEWSYQMTRTKRQKAMMSGPDRC